MAAPRRPRKKRAALDAAAVPREPLSAEELRRRAEEHLAGLDEAAAAAPEELAAAVHELRVHQIELEMQNEELRHAQLELDARRAKYLELFDLAPVGYLTLSDQGIVGDANLTAARLLGVERQLLVGQPFSAFVLPPDRDAYYVHFLKLVKTEAPQTCELRLQRLGDEPFWARLESQPQGGADGDEPFRYHLTFTDVHERVTAEESLRRSERALQSTVDGLAATIALLDERGTIVLVNQPWRDFAEHNGLTADAVFVGTNYLRVCDQATGAYSEGAAQFAAGIRAVLSAETDAYSMEYPCDAPDKKRWSAGRVTAFPGEGPRHVVVAHVDITERKQAVEALREREAVFRSVVEQAGDAIGLVDVATGRFVELNDAACRNLGYSHDELMSLSLADIDLQWPGEGIVPALAELQATGGNEFETRHRRKDGEIRDVRVTASLIDVAGRALFSAIWSDITERKRAEEELAGHRQRLEELVAERTEELGEANRILATGVAEVARWRQNFDTFFNTIDDLLFVLDADGTMIHVNETVCRRLGYSEAELLGRPVLDVHPPLRREEAGRIVAAMLSGEADFCPVPVVTKGGAEIPVETRVVPGVWDGEPALFGVTKDVSALKLSEEKFQRLFHGNPALMAVTSLPERIYTDVNEAFLSALGYSREEVLGRTATELGLFIEPEQQRELAEQMQARGRVADRELKVRRKDGTILEGLFSGEIIESRGQQYFLTVMIDQTERKLAEEELRQSEEQLARAVEGSGVGLWDWRPQTGAETFNERWAEIAGYTLAELTPTSIETWRGLTHPDDLKRADELLEEHFSGRSAIYACEARVRHKDGRWVWVLDQGKVSEWDSDGRPLRMTGTALDVSEGKRAEEALRQATDRLSLAARAGGVGVWDYDTVNDTLTWDDQMFALYGITREQFGGAYEAWQAGLHPGDKERGDAEIQMALRGEKDFDTEFRVLWPDGTVRDIHALALVQRDASGRATHMIGTNWDITEIKLTEERLRDANHRLEEAAVLARDLALQAQAATNAKSRFLANMSHEIRTPLNAIIGFAQLLQHDPQLSAQQGDRVAIINRSGEHLLALLSDILELSKVEAGRQNLDPTTFDLRELLEDLALVFRVRAEAKKLAFGADGLDRVPHYVTADQLKLRQILTNLLSNAVKFADSGGVWLRASASEESAHGSRLVVLVEDHGPGIAAAEMDALFAPFEQATAGHQRGSGTGLGLTISREFARIMGGDLSVTSEVGQGSIFRLEIPIEAGTAESAATKIAAPRVLRLEPDQPPCGVLVVDDQDGRTLLVDMLGEAGFDAFAAADGVEALAAFAIRRPRVVVMAYGIADVDSTAATSRIRSCPGGDAAKIVALTASATDEVRSSALAAGADAFMAKPFRAAELFEQIRLLTGVRYVYAEAAPPEAAASDLPPGLTREMMDVLPAELREQLRAAAVRARHGRLLKLTEQVAAIDPETGKELRKCVASFDYAAVLRVLEQEPS